MRRYFTLTVIGLVILFAGIKIGASAASKKYVAQFEPLRHQNIASEIELQIQILTLMSEGKSAAGNRMLLKWLEQNICEMGAYKQSKYFAYDSEVVTSVQNAKKYIEGNKLVVGECSKRTFSAYSGLKK